MEHVDYSECPHCNGKMDKWSTPDNSTWVNEFYLVCFNDDCPYFIKGWAHLKNTQNVNASYRHQVNPETGVSSPLPCWSKDAHKDRIIKD